MQTSEEWWVKPSSKSILFSSNNNKKFKGRVIIQGGDVYRHFHGEEKYGYNKCLVGCLIVPPILKNIFNYLYKETTHTILLKGKLKQIDIELV